MKADRRLADSSLDGTKSIADTFSSLAAPVIAEAVQRANELSASTGAESFHQLRVAFRKLRALYWAYAPYLGEEATAEAVDEFKRLAAAAGAIRDWDIAGELLQGAQASGASIEPLVAAIGKKREQAVADSHTAFGSTNIEAFLSGVLLRAQTTLQLQGDGLPVEAFAEERIRLAQRALDKRSRRATRSKTPHEEALHDVRKAGKKLRYLLEFFQPVVEDGRNRDIKALAAMQNELGQFNDLAASETLIRNSSFEAVPAGILQDSLQWLQKQKCRQMRAASKRVRAMAS
ncbi:CHAD domain-containing protein [Paraburkholderia sp. GAS199]|uniref:CHAD domain-containing protein n=1 Tax=Paraburkholderia sp. GAS199 TaxID=3035126 RepID=UPI003D1CD627